MSEDGIRTNGWCRLLGGLGPGRHVGHGRPTGATGVKDQQTGQQLPRWGSALDEPQDAEHDRGAHGPFHAQAHTQERQLWTSMHRPAVLGGLLAAAVHKIR